MSPSLPTGNVTSSPNGDGAADRSEVNSLIASRPCESSCGACGCGTCRPQLTPCSASASALGSPEAPLWECTAPRAGSRLAFAPPSTAVTPAVNAFPAQRPSSAATLRQNPPIREIIVMPGDTLWSLARKHRMGLNRLRSMNHLTDNQIEVGQTLFVFDHRVLTSSSIETIP